MKEKYYTPELEEFHIGFECEIESSCGMQKGKYPYVLKEDTLTGFTLNKLGETETLKKVISGIRVKYLDKEDIKTWFDDKDDPRMVNHIKPEYTFYRLLEDGTLYSVQVYWHMDREERENLIRIFKGRIHRYPYDEIFRGEIKNKSEFKKLLKQLRIL